MEDLHVKMCTKGVAQVSDGGENILAHATSFSVLKFFTFCCLLDRRL